MILKILFTFLLLFTPQIICPQNTITLKEAEQLFIQRNIELHESETAINVAQSAIKQAKLFHNPELSIEQVNLWSTKSQREGESILIPPLIGSSFGKNRQFSLELEQEIRLGGKRKKEIQVAQLNHQILNLNHAKNREESLLHFRSLVVERKFTQKYQDLLFKEVQLLQQVTKAYQKQKQLGFTSSVDFIRIQAASYELEQEYLEVNQEKKQLDEAIHSLIGATLSSPVNITLSPDSLSSYSFVTDELLLNLRDQKKNHPDLKISQQQIQLKQKTLALERAHRIPNITLLGNYDRHGGVWRNFLGFGVRFTLPLFNQNQGNIKAAQALLHLEKNRIETQKIVLQNRIQTEIELYQQLVTFNKKLTQELNQNDLDRIQEKYIKNLLQKNISVMEFLDFTTTVKEQQKILLENNKNIYLQYFTLLYTLGNKTIDYEN